MDKRISDAIDVGTNLIGCIKPGMPIVVVTGWRAGAGYTNTMRVIRIPEKAKNPKKISVLGAAREVPGNDKVLD